MAMQHEYGTAQNVRTIRRYPYVKPSPAVAALPPGLSVLGIPSIGKQISFSKRQVVFHQGDPATHLFWIEEGAAMVQQYLEDGRRQLVEIILPGDICGFSHRQIYRATCETLQPTVLRACRKVELERHAEFGWPIERQMERQLCALQEHALGLGRMTAQERVCTLLAKFAGIRMPTRFDRPPGEQQLQIQLPMTRGEIGDYLGLSLETICRTLTELQRMGVIGIGRQHGDVVIHGIGRLKRLAGSCAS